MSAGDGVTRLPEIFGKIDLHPGRGRKGHRIEVCVVFRQQPGSKSLDHAGRLDSGLVVREAFVGIQAGHADVQA